MTCSTGSTILAWSHGRTPVLVRREPIQLSPGHPLSHTWWVLVASPAKDPKITKTWAPGVGRQRWSPRYCTRGEQEKKRRAEVNAVRGPLVLVLRRGTGPGGKWRDESTGMEEDGHAQELDLASVVASKSCGQSNVRWILQLQPN
jgi:hypothetical protein